MGWIERKSVCGLSPEFAGVYAGLEALEGVETLGEVAGPQQVGEVGFELVVGVIETALDGSIHDGSVHALDMDQTPATLTIQLVQNIGHATC